MKIDQKIKTEMFNIYQNKGFSKIYNLVRKFVTSDLILKNKKELIKKLILGKKVLNIGSGITKLGSNVINLDIDTFKNVNIVGDCHHLPFKNDSFNTVWIDAVLEHVKNPKIVVNEIYRVLRGGGKVFATVPFICPFHSYPNDFLRWSIEGLKELFKDFKLIDVDVYRGPTTALINFLSDYFTLFSFSDKKLINYSIKGFFTLCLLPLKFLDFILIKNKRAKYLAQGYYIISKKVIN